MTVLVSVQPDVSACLEALAALAGAALDVFAQEPLSVDSPHCGVPNLLVTPHTSGVRSGHRDDAVGVFIDNLGRRDRSEPLQRQVDIARGC